MEDLGVALESLRGRRVLVTGHTGFKGSWLSLWLQELGAQVSGIALDPTDPGHFLSCRIADGMRHRVVDIRDFDAFGKALDEARPEVVFHMAAQALVRPSYDDPKTTFDTNVGGTVNVLEWGRRSKDLRALVVVTSDKCYENQEWVHAYRETDPLGGHDPYSASKGAAEIVASAYRRSFFASQTAARIASARAGNVIGGGDWADHRLVPDCIRALQAGKPLVLRNPDSVRPWQHVLEPLSGYLLLASHLLRGTPGLDALNFGPEPSAAVTVRELAATLVKGWGAGSVVEAATADTAKHEAQLLRLACDKARALLGWNPRLDARTAIEWTIEWYRTWASGASSGALRALSVSQIHAYVRGHL